MGFKFIAVWLKHVSTFSRLSGSFLDWPRWIVRWWRSGWKCFTRRFGLELGATLGNGWNWIDKENWKEIWDERKIERNQWSYSIPGLQFWKSLYDSRKVVHCCISGKFNIPSISYGWKKSRTSILLCHGNRIGHIFSNVDSIPIKK